MSQASSVLRKTEGGYSHWCPGCEQMHVLPHSWSFNGDVERPTFNPSFKHEGMRRVFVSGEWRGDWERDANGNTIPFVCHYILTAGVLNFCNDSTHAMAGKSIALPTLPEGITE